MKIEHKILGNTLYVGLSGELDESCAAVVRDTLDTLSMKSGIQRLVINLEQLRFMDSTGIGVLIGRYRKLKTRGIPILIESPPKSVDRILSLSGIYDIMPKIAE